MHATELPNIAKYVDVSRANRKGKTELKVCVSVCVGMVRMVILLLLCLCVSILVVE